MESNNQTPATGETSGRTGEDGTLITKFDPNYQGDASDKLEAPEDQNVLDEEYDRGPFDLANMPTTPEPGAAVPQASSDV